MSNEYPITSQVLIQECHTSGLPDREKSLITRKYTFNGINSFFIKV